MKLAFGSAGEEVRKLQALLNQLSPGQPEPLATDGRFGPKTRTRVMAFQQTNNLVADGVVGPLTMDAILELLRKLGILPSPVLGAVRPINKEILGLEGKDNLIQQIIPAIDIVNTASFRPGDQKNVLQFLTATTTTARLGIFAARKDNVDRAVILLLPKSGVPDRVLICVTQGFAQASAKLDALGWSNPLSPPLIQFCLLKHVVNRFGAQMLASRKNMALMYIVRAKGKELGPFAQDGAFVRQTLTEMAALTNNSFTFDKVEAFTFSSGIVDFNPFIASVGKQLSVAAVYSIDPAQALGTSIPAGGVRKQFLSGQTGGPRAGFEFLGLNRWQNEERFATHKTIGDFQYLHNHAMPSYALFLGLQT